MLVCSGSIFWLVLLIFLNIPSVHLLLSPHTGWLPYFKFLSPRIWVLISISLSSLATPPAVLKVIVLKYIPSYNITLPKFFIEIIGKPIIDKIEVSYLAWHTYKALLSSYTNIQIRHSFLWEAVLIFFSYPRYLEQLQKFSLPLQSYHGSLFVTPQ